LDGELKLSRTPETILTVAVVWATTGAGRLGCGALTARVAAAIQNMT